MRDNERVPNEIKDGAPAPAAAGARRDSAAAGAAGRKRDTEGVFVVRNGLAQFQPVRVGIAGDEYFEVLDGLKQGDSIVAGPYQAIRDLKDSTKVKPAPAASAGDGEEKKG